MAREVVKSVVIKGKAQTGNIPKALKEIQKGTSKVGVAANKTKREMDGLAGGVNKTQKAMDKTSASLKALGAIGLVAAAKGMIELADRGAEVNTVMKNLPFSIDEAKKASNGFADSMMIGQSAIKLNRLELIKSSQDMADFVEIGTKLGATTGEGTKALETLTTGIVNQSNLRLDALGIQVDVNEAESRYAQILGKLTSELSETEKAQAFTNEVLRKGKIAIESVNVDAHTKSWLELKVTLKDFKDNVAVGATTALGAIAAGLMDVDGAISDRILEFFGSSTGPRTGMRSVGAILDTASNQGIDNESTRQHNRQKMLDEEWEVAMANDRAMLQGLGSAKPTKGSRGGRRGKRDDRSDLEKALEGFDPRKGDDSALREFQEEEQAILDKRREAGIAFTEAMIDAELARAEAEEDAHKKRLAQMAAEEKARLDAIRKRKEAGQALVGALTEHANAANAAAELGLIGEKKAAGFSILAGGIRLAWRAAEMGAEGIANIASQNYVKGAAQLAAAAALTVQSGLHFGKAAQLGAGGPQGGGAGRTPSLGPGIGGGGGGSDAPTLGGGDRPGIPTSRPSDVPPPSPANGPPPSGGNTYVFQGNLIAGSEEELGLKLREIEKNTAQRFGT